MDIEFSQLGKKYILSFNSTGSFIEIFALIVQLCVFFLLLYENICFSRLIILDVNAPRSEIEDYGDEVMDEDDGGGEEVFKIDAIQEEEKKPPPKVPSQHPLAHTLDICMEKLLEYVYDVCHPHGKLDMESAKSLYFDLLQVFETTILPTWASHHVQFVMFYICSFKSNIAEAFLNWLWLKVSNPNVAPVIRQSAVAYIASLLARANFIPIK